MLMFLFLALGIILIATGAALLHPPLLKHLDLRKRYCSRCQQLMLRETERAAEDGARFEVREPS